MPRKKINLRRSQFHNWKWIIGLTGGMGTGKSTVLQIFKRKRFFTLDADTIVRQILRSDRNVRDIIRKKFGSEVIGPSGIDRKKLAPLVFSTRNKRKLIEKILHPLVRKEIADQLRKRQGELVVCDIPLLFESGWDSFFDKTLVVWASMPKRFMRLKKRGYMKQDYQARIEAQMPLAKKMKKADFVIHNNGTKKQTEEQVARIIQKILNTTKGRSHGLTSRK